jgi:hypothetical protein
MDIVSNIEFQSENLVQLSSKQVDEAMTLARSRAHAAQQWQTYLNVLALYGFERWLSQRDPEIDLHCDRCSVFHPLEPELAVVSNLEANGFRLCLIPTSPNEVIDLPQVVVEQADQVAHFYVAITVYEEQAQVEIDGYLRYDQLAAQRSSLQLAEDGAYAVPFTWFDPDPDHLLLCLRCSDPAAIPLPMNQPEPLGLQPLTQPLTPQPLINVGLWLHQQLDALAAEWSWILLPPPPLGLEMRSSLTLERPQEPRMPAGELYGLLRELERSGLRLPTQRASGYRDWQLANIPLRLFIVTGALPDVAEPEWMLLLILGAQPGTDLPTGLSLRICSDATVLVERSLDSPAAGDYLIAQVVGSLAEQFVATLTLPDGQSVTFPPFAFQPQ